MSEGPASSVCAGGEPRGGAVVPLDMATGVDERGRGLGLTVSKGRVRSEDKRRLADMKQNR